MQISSRLKSTGWRVPAAVLAALALGLAIALLPPGQLTIAAGAALALGVTAAIFAEPVIGLALTLFAAPFGPLENIVLRLPVESGQALLFLTLAAWITRMAYRRKLGIRTGPLVWPVLLFIAAGVLSFFAARSFELWAKECLKWIEVLAVYALAVGEIKTSPRALKVLIGVILVSTLIEAALGIYQFGLRGEGPHEFAILGGRFYRAYGTFEQPNPFGGYMGLTWPLAAGVALWAWRDVLRRGAEEQRSASFPILLIAIAATLITALAAVALVLSWSRGAWLGAGAAVVVMFIVAWRKPLASVSILAAVVVAVVAFNLTDLLPASLRDRLTNFTQEFSSLDVRGVAVSADNFSVIERLAHWQAAQNMILAQPYFGVGFGNYPAAYEEYRALNWPIALGHAHNYYLNVFAETGIAGLLAYLVMWIAIVMRTLRTTDDERRTKVAFALRSAIALGLLGAWVHISVHQLVDNLYVANIFLLIGAYLGLLDGVHDELKVRCLKPVG